MKLADIQQELIRLFETQDAARGGALVVWHDPDSAFTDAVDDLELVGVEVLREQENALFELKRILNGDLSNRRILLYRPHARRLEGNWLADIEARYPSFSADYISLQLRELNASNTPEIRAALNTYKKQLKKKTVLRKLTRLSDSYTQPQQLACGLMAIALDCPSIEPELLIQQYLLTAYEEDGKAAYERLERFDCAEDFCCALSAWTGFTGNANDFIALATHVLLAALSHCLPQDITPLISTAVNEQQFARCHSAVHDWAYGAERDALFELSQLVEEQAQIKTRLSNMHLEALAQIDALPCVDAQLIQKLFICISEHPEQASIVDTLVAQRRNTAWYNQFADFYQGLKAAANIQQFHNKHPQGFEAASPEQLWKLYTTELYAVDTWYRKLHCALNNAVCTGLYNLDEGFRTCCTQMENLYKNAFLGKLSERWEAAVEPYLAKDGFVPNITQQRDFYLSEVQPLLHSKKRVCVVISDALRYEVAVELAETLERNTKGTCNLSSMQAAFPSITSCGMAALLPCSSSEFSVDENNKLIVQLDKNKVNSTPLRQAQLQRFETNSIAINSDDLVNEMSSAERKALAKDAQVIYIYHNTIDALGDKPQTQRKVFAACDDAIRELSDLVRLLTRDRITQNIIITSDHGFLYTAESLLETDYAQTSSIHGNLCYAGRRFAIAEVNASSQDFLNIALPGSNSKLTGFAPRGYTHIKRAGSGENYVHGGVSLQELCVPVLHFSNKRAGTKGYVDTEQAKLSLVSTIDTISNSLVNLNLLQDKPVGGKVLPASYEVFVGTNTHVPVTNVTHVVTDRTSKDATARVITIKLCLKPGVSTSEQELYHLFARNLDTGEISNLRDLHIRVAFAPTIDFGW